MNPSGLGSEPSSREAEGDVRADSGESQGKRKHWYGRNARIREFVPGDLVLVLLPTSSSKLLAQWQGSYQVVKRTGKVNYLVDIHHH